MSRFKEIFKDNKKVVLPIIIAESFTVAKSKTQIALDSGADGIFLQKAGSADFAEVNGWAGELRKNSNLFIGIYHPEQRPVPIFQFNPKASGILADSPEIREITPRKGEYSIILNEANEIKEAREKSSWKGLFFAGISLRNEPMVADLEKLSQITTKYVDVIVTDNLENTQNVRASIGPDFPIAALGVTLENVGEYKNLVNCFITSDIRIRDFVSTVKAKL